MTEEKAFGPHLKESLTYRQLPIGAVSIGIHDDVIKTGSWRTLRPIFKTKTPPCSEACPAGVDVRGFMSLIKQGLFKEAHALYMEENPFPSICGRVCDHPCQEACNRKAFDQAVGINALERFLADFESPLEEIQPLSGKGVAIVGSGPAGMTCAYYLAKLGHQVTVFEALDVIGGLLRTGIPDYRLPLGIVEKEVQKLKGMTVEFRTKHRVCKENWKELETYDAILLAYGASEPLPLPLDSSIHQDNRILTGLDFLKTVKTGGNVPLGRRVAVIGGGNTAVDAARVSLRLGASPTIIYRRSRMEMPAFEDEIEEALEEGVHILFLTSPITFEKGEGGLNIQCIKNRMGEPDEGGRPMPFPVEGTGFFVETDNIIMAVGEISDLSFLPQGIESLNQTVHVNEIGATSKAGIFACGDLTDEPRSVAQAIGSGKKAAIAIDCYLKGNAHEGVVSALTIGEKGGVSFKGYLEGISSYGSQTVVRYEDLNPDYFEHCEPYARPKLPKEARTGFLEIQGNISKEDALGEAGRCLSCGMCDHCHNCYLLCPDGSVHMEKEHVLNRIDYEYCKGCGICENECPVGIIEMEVEG